jgi:hypothetical protein
MLGAIIQQDGSLNNNLPRIQYVYGKNHVILNGHFDVELLDAIAVYIGWMKKQPKLLARSVTFYSSSHEVKELKTDE